MGKAAEVIGNAIFFGVAFIALLVMAMMIFWDSFGIWILSLIIPPKP